MLKISTLNLHNFFIAPPIAEGESKKADSKVLKIAQQIRQMDSDIILVQEVGGIHSLQRFCLEFLQGDYLCRLVPGNSSRGIEVGYLYKSSLAIDVELLGHRERHIDRAPLGHFSRDVSQLNISSQGILQLVILNVHLKSKRSLGDIDPEGELQRLCELEAALEIFCECEASYQVPVVLGGDFNSPEAGKMVEELGHPEIKDILNYTKAKERWTHVFFDKAKKRHLLQFDYLFISDKWKDLINLSASGRYADQFAFNLPHLPHQLFQASTDHFPLSMVLNTAFCK